MSKGAVVARAFQIALFVLASSCAAVKPPADPIVEERHVGQGVRSRAVLVTIDGVRWQDVFESRDRLPNLHRLASTRGALLGAPGRGVINASGPEYVSLPG